MATLGFFAVVPRFRDNLGTPEPRNPGTSRPLDDIRAVDIAHAHGAGLAHRRAQFAAEDVEPRSDAGLTETAQAPDMRPAHHNRAGADRQSLEDVGSPAETAIHDDRDAPLHAFDHFDETFDPA